MDIRVQAGDPTTFACDGLIVGLFEGERDLQGATAEIDRALGGQLREVMSARVVTGKLGDAYVLFTFGKLPAARVCLAGLGKREGFTPDRVRHAAANAVRALRASGARQIATVLLSAGEKGVTTTQAAEAIAEGCALGGWKFLKYRTGADDKNIEAVTLLTDATALSAAGEGAERGRIIAEATNLARDLANEPGNALTPTVLSSLATEMAEAHGLEHYIITRDGARQRGMGAFLGVAQGSDEPPAIIVLRYWGAGRDAAPGLGLIGKAITFDSGGISLKPADKMGSMKADMSGGAAVIAAMQAIAQLKPKINVTGIIPATENLPSGKALKPGDILRASNGKTIEIISTDAEGRLVLADALVHATQELHLSPVVDCATLTGSITRALGVVRAGLFSNDEAFQARLQRIGEETGEKMWAMPMDEEYRDYIRSDWADIKNSGGLLAGSITAAWFIRHFVGDTPWAHLDIAGTAQTGDGKEHGYVNKFGTGVPTRTLIQLALELAEH